MRCETCPFNGIQCCDCPELKIENQRIEKMITHCQNCGKETTMLYDIKRYRDLGFISFFVNRKKNLETVCMDCIQTEVLFFVDKKHNATVELRNPNARKV